jgi:hypothetical protein
VERPISMLPGALCHASCINAERLAVLTARAMFAPERYLSLCDGADVPCPPQTPGCVGVAASSDNANPTTRCWQKLSSSQMQAGSTAIDVAAPARYS